MDLSHAPEPVRTFAGGRIRHRALDTALDDLLRKTRAGATRNFLYVMGPSGVGKTTLLTRAYEDLTSSFLALLGDDPSAIPVTRLASAGPSGTFDPFFFYLSGLADLGEPAVDDRKTQRGHRPGAQRLRSVGDARSLFIETVGDRKTRVAFVDEASHIRHGTRNDEVLHERLDMLKTLADETGLVFVLAGTYELLALRNVSEQLGRRASDVHFPRYSSTPDDQRAFGEAMAKLLGRMPIDVDPDVGDYMLDFFERTAGCVGLVKVWMTEALWSAMDEGAALARRHLMANRPHIDAVLLAARAIDEGETALAETEAKEWELRDRLKLGRPDLVRPAELERTEPLARGRAKKRRGRLPGRRHPVRDQVG